MWDYKTSSPDRYALLKEFARENRKHATAAEDVLWQHIKGNKLGHKFFRQHIVLDYIVDFICQDDGLIIEVDGGYHAERQQQEDDMVRQKRLENMGYQVIRFTNEEVLFEIEQTIETIINRLK